MEIPNIERTSDSEKKEYGLVISTSIAEVDFEPTSFRIIYLMILILNDWYRNYLHRKYRIAFGVLDVDQGVAYGIYQDSIQTNGYNISCLSDDIYDFIIQDEEGMPV